MMKLYASITIQQMTSNSQVSYLIAFDEASSYIKIV
jgi:hypothetical protein